MIIFDPLCPVFILAPTDHLYRHIWHYRGYKFDRIPGRLIEHSDWQRLQGVTKFHVIQATSPRKMPLEDDPAYLELCALTRERFLLNIGRGPDAGMGNSWVRVVLP